jgi:serine/threonine-protein kinase RsbW
MNFIKTNEITLTAPNLPDMEIMISDIASSVASNLRLSQNEIDEIKLAVIEACLNSFEHSRSSDNKVTVRFYPEKDSLKIVIEDNGIGFNPGEIEAPDIKKIISGEEKRHRGWGLKIIKSFMDEVKIDSDKSGTKLTLIKRLKNKGQLNSKEDR